MSLALIEGPGLMWVVSTMILGEIVWLSGAGLTVLLLGGLFPNEQQFESWLETPAEEIDAQLGGKAE